MYVLQQRENIIRSISTFAAWTVQNGFKAVIQPALDNEAARITDASVDAILIGITTKDIIICNINTSNHIEDSIKYFYNQF